MTNLFRFLIRLNRKKSLVTTMTEKEVEYVNRCIRIILISLMMAVIWFTIQELIQITLNYQIHDLVIGTICFTIVYLLYPALMGSKTSP
ncbi:hypothetical protein ACS4JF_04425 [Bacillus thuringiensis]|uniref:hypothetical protein n=2 Tax=Bacillus cereus group TaxID=86661 RepID=UPI0015CF3DF8|nr:MULTISPECIES: hypothetical protein [Bacillus cereus group]MDM8363066.1 hypothetical protein [Bacillus thuringiensis]MED2785752.1 hypothetical protein [Bacillus thuringiensis]MED2810116.1 hypothetical protein [Bacillus thuringiensis]MED2827258.1 hypothetical protein [Bacillus thuringiensis]MED2832976.1 hypothetical protein [Bacillus thuringiensis]